jgi:predicted MFS family arabinose efflux permease
MASLLGGGVWAVLNPGLVNRLMEKAPDDDRPAYMALHNLVLNLGVLAGSLASPLLDGWIGLRAALLLAAALRLLAGVSLYFGDKEQKEEFSGQFSSVRR